MSPSCASSAAIIVRYASNLHALPRHLDISMLRFLLTDSGVSVHVCSLANQLTILGEHSMKNKRSLKCHVQFVNIAEISWIPLPGSSIHRRYHDNITIIYGKHSRFSFCHSGRGRHFLKILYRMS